MQGPNFDQVGNTSVSLLAKLACHPQDPAAWARFMMIYGSAILRWCEEQGMQEADAVDLTQEVLVQFWRQTDRFQYDPNKTLRGYLRRMVYIVWVDWMKKKSKHVEGTGGSGILELLASVPMQEDLLMRLNTIFDIEIAEVAMRLVRQQIEPQTWMAFQLLAIDGLSGKEAAEQIGIKVGSVIAARCEVQRKIRNTILRIEKADAQLVH